MMHRTDAERRFRSTPTVLTDMMLGIVALATRAERIDIGAATLDVDRRGRGAPIVFFDAGALSGLAGWDAIWDRLPDTVTAIRYSRRGEGDSTACSGQLTATDYAQDAERLLGRLGITEPIVYVSHSYGSAVARAFAARHPDRIAAMLFVDPINPRDVEILTEVDPENGPAEIASIRQNDLTMATEQGWCFIDDVWAKEPSPGFDAIGDIPITVIAGVRRVEEPETLFHTDHARRRWGEIQAEWVEPFPRGKAVLTEDSGHFVQDDEPDLVVRELASLLDRMDSH
ncbi:MAG: alpha/beta fold hydrolase [Acidobacteriota bacterium]